MFFFCRKPGHLIAECRAWKGQQPSPNQKQPKGVGLIKMSPQPQGLEPEMCESDDCFKPFIFEGFVSLTGKVEDQRRVRILRDTACSQSLMLSGTLPVCDSSDVSAVVRGIEMGFVPVPLHRIFIHSDLVTGFFTVGVRAGFPIEGIEVIVGNDIAGGKVFPVPRVVSNPIPESEQDGLGKIHPHIFVASVTKVAVS